MHHWHITGLPILSRPLGFHTSGSLKGQQMWSYPRRHRIDHARSHGWSEGGLPWSSPPQPTTLDCNVLQRLLTDPLLRISWEASHLSISGGAALQRSPQLCLLTMERMAPCWVNGIIIVWSLRRVWALWGGWIGNHGGFFHGSGWLGRNGQESGKGHVPHE